MLLVVLKINAGDKIRSVSFYLSPIVCPLHLGQDSGADVVVAGLPACRLEYQEELTLYCPQAVYRITEMVQSKISPGTKVVIQDQDSLQIADVRLRFFVTTPGEDYLLRHPQAAYFLEKNYGKLWLVARGSSSCVYVSADATTALKILAPGYEDAAAIRRFQQSGETVKLLDHLGLLDSGGTASHPQMELYYTRLQYFPGVTLEESIARRGLPTTAQTLSIVKQLAEVIAYLQSQQVVHGNISPENLMLGADFQLKVTGTTWLRSNAGEPGDIKPTLSRFGAPELAECPQDADGKADVFSLGTIAYYLFAGTPPFNEIPAGTQSASQKNFPVPLEQQRGLPHTLCRLIMRCLALDRQERPSIQEFLTRYNDLIARMGKVRTQGISARKLRESQRIIWEGFIDPQVVHQLGRFQIIRKIGQGGLGHVYEARDTKINRRVALKILRKGAFVDDADLKRFQEEARMIAQLQHPGINTLYEVGHEEGHHYMVMQLVDGVTLDKWSQEQSINAVAAVIKKIAEILEYAHSRHIIHRDIKPSNIMVQKDGSPVLLDFGMARDIQRDSKLTKSGVFVGTPVYAAPEQIRQAPPAPAMDVYSLGVVLYELLSGQLPYDCDPVHFFNAIVKEKLPQPKPLRQWQPRVPADLEAICAYAMAFDPGSRYSSPKDLADDLDNFLNDRNIQGRHIGQIQRTWRWLRRHWQYSICATLIVLLLVGSWGVGLHYARKSRRQAIQRNLDYGLELASIFPGDTPRETFRKARRYLENARSYAPRDQQIKRALVNLYLKYGNWALSRKQTELAEDSVAALEVLDVPENDWRDFAGKVARTIYRQRQRRLLIDWEQPIRIRLAAAQALADDKSPETLAILKQAQNDPAPEIRQRVNQILTPTREMPLAADVSKQKRTHVAVTVANNGGISYHLRDFLPVTDAQAPVLPLLLILLSDPANRSQHQLIPEILEFLDRDRQRGLAELSELVQNPNQQIREQAIYLCSCLSDREMVIALVPVLLAELAAGRSRMPIERCLARIGKFAVGLLIKQLSHHAAKNSLSTILVEIGPDAIPALLKAVAEPGSPIREEIFAILEKIGEPGLPLLVPYLDHLNLGVRHRLAQLVAAHGAKAVPELLQAIAGNKPQLQLKAIEVLGQIGPAAIQAREKLLPMFRSDNALLRYTTLQTLLKICRPDIALLPVLSSSLGDSDPRIKRLALAAITAMRDRAKQALPALLRLLTQESPQLQQQVILALAAIGPAASKSIPQLRQLFAKSDWRLRYIIAYAVVCIRYPDKAELQRLALALNDSQAARRYQAMQRLRPWARFAWLCFLAALPDPDPETSIAAMRILAASYACHRALPGLIGNLSHPAARVRREAITLISRFGTKAAAAMPAFLAGLEDHDEQVRLAVLANIPKILPVPAQYPLELLNALVTTALSSSGKVQIGAISMLREIGDAAAAVAGKLLPLLAQDNPQLQQEVERTLLDIGHLALADVRKALADSGVATRLQTLRLLTQIHQDISPLWRDLMALLPGSSKEMRTAIAAVLARIKQPPDEDIVIAETAARSPYPYIQLPALQALEKYGSKAAAQVDYLIGLLLDRHHEIRQQALRTLAAIGDQAMAPLLQLLRTTPKEALARQAARALGSMPPAIILERLMAELDSEQFSEDYYQRIAFALGTIGLPALPRLRSFFTDNKRHRRRAAWALVYIGPPALQALTDLLSHQQWGVRRYSAWCLGSIASFPDSENRKQIQRSDAAMQAAFSKLTICLRDTKADVRLEAAKAIGNIAAYLDNPWQPVPELIELLAPKMADGRPQPQALKLEAARALYKIRSHHRHRSWTSQIERVLKTAGLWPPPGIRDH